MTEIIFKKIKWKNFLSTGIRFTEIDLNKTKTTLIVGKNGSGKTTFLDALSFVLFNRPFRKIKKPLLVNSVNKKNCVVEIEFDVNTIGYKIVRGMKPGIFEIYRDEKLITQDSDNRDYQTELERDILRMDHRTFFQIVILGVAGFTPFMSLDAKHRREFVEELLNLQIFTIMNTFLKDRIATTERTLDKKRNEKSLIKAKIDVIEKQTKSLQETNEDIIIEKRSQIEAFENTLKELADEITILKGSLIPARRALEEKSIIEKKNMEMTLIHDQLQQKMNRISKEIEFFSKNDVCPTCSQDISFEFKYKTITQKQSTIKEIEEGIEKLVKHFDIIKARLVNLDKTQKEYDRNKSSLQEKLIHISSLEAAKDQTKKDIEKLLLKKAVDDFSDVGAMQAELVEVEKIILELSDDMTVMDVATVLLKDSGIKAKIIKTFIPIINQLLQKHLAALDFFVEFYLNEEFEETIKSRYRDEFQYESFSEGEKFKINLAILFTWRSMAKLRSMMDVNLLVFDELLDSSLDVDGVDEAVKIISNLSEKENVFIISHKDQVMDRFDRVLKFSKEKMFSQLVQC